MGRNVRDVGTSGRKQRRKNYGCLPQLNTKNISFFPHAIYITIFYDYVASGKIE